MAVSASPVTYSWIHNGTRLALGSSNRRYRLMNGNLTIINTTLDDTGEYRCIASNRFGSALSLKADIRIACEYNFICSINIKESFTCDSSGRAYWISCRRCPAIYIGETGRTPGNVLENIHEELPSVRLVFLSQINFNSHGHSLDDAHVRSNKQRKRHEMRLIFQLGTWQPRGLNSNFRFC